MSNPKMDSRTNGRRIWESRMAQHRKGKVAFEAMDADPEAVASAWTLKDAREFFVIAWAEAAKHDVTFVLDHEDWPGKK